MHAILSGSLCIDLLSEIQSWFSEVNDIINIRLINKAFSSVLWLPLMKKPRALWLKSLYHNKLEYIQLLLKNKRIDPSTNNNETIRWASRKCYIEVVRELLKDQRVDPAED